jgi:hypothetical protein
MILKIGFLSLISLALYGCSGNRGGHSLNSQFNPKEAMYIFTVGRASISGQAFVRTSDGKTHPARNSKVTLVPATSYAQERISAIYGGRRGANRSVKFPNADPRYHYFTRKTTADAKGNFSFVDISGGDYYVTTTVQWGKGRRKVRALIKRVNVGGNSKEKIVLSESAS